MPDDPKNHGPADHNEVNVDDPGEVTLRREEYGCTEQQLRAAVGAWAAKGQSVFETQIDAAKGLGAKV